MPLQSLDHINIHTENLGALAAWYERVLDLKIGRARHSAAMAGGCSWATSPSFI